MIGPTCIIQARMSSTRLPGKVLMQLGAHSVLELVLRRLARSRHLVQLVVATTTEPEDDAIVTACSRLSLAKPIEVHRGSLTDVLSRYVGAASAFGGDPLIRVTSDCPLIDPGVIDSMLERFAQTDCDYLSNAIERTFPRGLDTEVFSKDALMRAAGLAQQPHEREHVTPFIYQHPERFRLQHWVRETNRSALRWTLDTPEDLAFLAAFMQRIQMLGHNVVDIDIETLLKIFDSAPELAQINQHIQQKSLHA